MALILSRSSLRHGADGQDKDGRLYTIIVADLDQAGNKGTVQTVVTVPHDPREWQWRKRWGELPRQGKECGTARPPVIVYNLGSHSPTSPPIPRGPLVLMSGFTTARRNPPAQALPDKRS